MILRRKALLITLQRIHNLIGSMQKQGHTMPHEPHRKIFCSKNQE